MSNLYSYFQRIDQKKMPAVTTAESMATTPTNTKTTKKSLTMTNNDIYSADSPKSEKRKQSQSQERMSQNSKSSI